MWKMRPRQRGLPPVALRPGSLLLRPLSHGRGEASRADGGPSLTGRWFRTTLSGRAFPGNTLPCRNQTPAQSASGYEIMAQMAIDRIGQPAKRFSQSWPTAAALNRPNTAGPRSATRVEVSVRCTTCRKHPLAARRYRAAQEAPDKPTCTRITVVSGGCRCRRDRA